MKRGYYIVLGVLLIVGSVGYAESAGLLPSAYDLQHNVHKPSDGIGAKGQGGGVVNVATDVSPCDPSATSSRCLHQAVVSTQQAAEPGSASESPVLTDVPMKQSGAVDAHVTMNNSFKTIDFCGKKYQGRQVLIDGVDIVQKLAYTVTNHLVPKSAGGDDTAIGFCRSLPQNDAYTKGVLGISDVQKFVSSDTKRLPGDSYLINIGSQGFDVNLSTGNIYMIDAYDGSLVGPIAKFK